MQKTSLRDYLTSLQPYLATPQPYLLCIQPYRSSPSPGLSPPPPTLTLLALYLARHRASCIRLHPHRPTLGDTSTFLTPSPAPLTPYRTGRGQGSSSLANQESALSRSPTWHDEARRFPRERHTDRATKRCDLEWVALGALRALGGSSQRVLSSEDEVCHRDDRADWLPGSTEAKAATIADGPRCASQLATRKIRAFRFRGPL